GGGEAHAAFVGVHFEAGEDAQAVGVAFVGLHVGAFGGAEVLQVNGVFGAAEPVAQGVFAGVAEGRVTEVVGEAGDLDDRADVARGVAFGQEAAGLHHHADPVADAAGLAEATYGQGRDKMGLIAVITLGTGIGSALINNGVLVPNTELGHLEIDGHDAESRASARAREVHELSWKKYASKRLRRYFQHVEALFSPDLFIIGGGISKNPEKFMPYFEDEIRTPMVMATLRNNAGIVGAALWAGGMLPERQRRGEA
ncbi:MAG: hypothetical protein ACFNLE_00005, partial [Rothia aeria]